jgi:hypothetical protein
MAITIGLGIEIGSGISISATSAPPLTPVLSLDAGNPASYPGSGTTWTDTVSSIPFTLVNGPTYSSSNGGYLQFNPGAGQFGYSTTPNLGTLANWSIEAWHYYDGTNTSAGPNIFTEFPYGGGTINLGLGANAADTDLQTWWYGGGFHTTPSGYSLTPGAWYQIVGTFDGTTLNLYVNNALVQTANAPPGAAANPGIGYGLMTRWDPGGLWGGKLAIVNIYNSDIGAGGVTTSWNTNKARFGL